MSVISIVIPVYNEEECLEELLSRLAGVQSGSPDQFEFVFVDDGSSDNSFSMLSAEAEHNRAVKVLRLSRNFGHQVALTAGLDHASGDAVVTMDADLQDPPELVTRMVGKWREGLDVVYARRLKRKGESIFKRATAWLFYRLLGRLASLNIPRDTGDFRLMSRKAVMALNQMRERHRFLRAMTAWVGFRQGFVEYERPSRLRGDTKYGLSKMLRLAADALVSFSWVPLRLAMYAGLLAILLCGIYLFANLVLWAFTDLVLPGWMSLAALITLLGSFQLLTLGILGEYVGRILDEAKARPLYLLHSRINISKMPPVEAGPEAATQRPEPKEEASAQKLDAP